MARSEPGGADHVCAVVAAPAGGNGAGPVVEAVERQTRPPGQVVTLPAHGRLAEQTMESPWLWLLDGSVVPEPAALERLLEIVERPGPLPAPILLASQVVSASGAFDPSSLPVAQVMDRDVAIAAFERRVVSLRLVRGESLLVHRDWVQAPGRAWLDPFTDDLEWAARVLWEGPGVLVPQSVAVRRPLDAPAARRRARRSLLERASLLRTDAIDPTDKPWFVLRLLEDAVEHARRGARRRGPVSRRAAS